MLSHRVDVANRLCVPRLLQELTPDYSMESHQRDHENFLVVSRNRRRRAKALLDFERHDDDELGFRKNDIITVSWRVADPRIRPNVDTRVCVCVCVWMLFER